MPRLETAADVIKLRDQMRTDKARLVSRRQILDGRLPQMAAFKAMLADHVQKAFMEYQDPVPGEELFTIIDLMVANQAEIKVLVRSTEQPLINAGQRLEYALEALDERLFPITTQIDECHFMGEGYQVLSLEPLPGGEHIAQYGDHESLRAYAEEERDEEDDEDDGPEARYRRAYRQHGDHEKAYDAVTREALINDGLRMRVRVVNSMTFDCFEGDEEGQIAIGMEYGQKPLNPLLQAFEDYGLRREGGRLVLDGGGTSPSYSALGAVTLPPVATMGGTDATDEMGELVGWTMIRTHEQTVVLIEHPAHSDPKDPGVLFTFDNLFGGKSTGYYLISGDKLPRERFEDRYRPPLWALMHDSQRVSLLSTAYQTMALEEATRDVYVQDVRGMAIQPHDASEESKAPRAVDGDRSPVVAGGEVKRVAETGIKLEEATRLAIELRDRHTMSEFFVGSGSSSETGVHLARLQTALLTKMTPYQIKRAAVHKRILQDVLCMVRHTGETVMIPYLPKTADPDSRTMEIREITPKLAKLPIDIQYTIGADTPQSDYARMQVSGEQMQLGTWSMSTHRENSGVKDPAREVKLIAIDNIVREYVGTADQPGRLATQVASILDRYTKAKIEQQYGPLPPEPMPIAVDAMGNPVMQPQPMMPPMGGIGVNMPNGSPAVQVAPGGAPVEPGGPQIPA